MAEEDDGFVARWARRKRDARSEEQPEAVQPPEAVAEEGREIDPEAGDPEVDAKLPDIDSLDETSDFTPFMAKGVPEMLRRRALRKLWRINPVFAHLDGLNEYDEDFTDAATVVENLKTLYKVGKGMVPDEDEEEAPGDAAAEPSEPSESPENPEQVAEVGEAATAPPPPPQPPAPPESPTDSSADDVKPAPKPVAKGAAKQRRWGRS